MYHHQSSWSHSCNADVFRPSTGCPCAWPQMIHCILRKPQKAENYFTCNILYEFALCIEQFMKTVCEMK